MEFNHYSMSEATNYMVSSKSSSEPPKDTKPLAPDEGLRERKALGSPLTEGRVMHVGSELT